MTSRLSLPTLAALGHRMRRSSSTGRLQGVAVFTALLSVGILALVLSLVAVAYSGRVAHDAARSPYASPEFDAKFVPPDFRAAEPGTLSEWERKLSSAPLLWSNRYDTVAAGPEFSVDIRIAQDPNLPPPPGLPRWPRPGEAFLSPQLLSDGAGEQIEQRYGVLAGTIGSEGLSAVDERYAVVNPRPGSFPASDLYAAESIGIPVDQTWWSPDLHAATGETQVVYAAPTMLLAALLALGLPVMTLLVVARRVGREDRAHHRMVMQAMGANGAQLRALRLGELAIPAVAAAGIVVGLVLIVALVPIRIPITAYLLPTEWIRSALPTTLVFVLLLMAVATGFLTAGNPRAATDAARPTGRRQPLPTGAMLISPAAMLAAAYLPHMVDPGRQAPWVLVYFLCCAVSIATLPLAVTIVLRLFGNTLAERAARRQRPGAMMAWRLLLDRPRAVAITMAVIVVGTGLLMQSQFATHSLGERARLAFQVREQLNGRTVEAAYSEGMPEFNGVARHRPPGAAMIVITDARNGRKPQINGTCADLTAFHLPCPEAGRTAPLPGNAMPDLAYVGLSAPVVPGQTEISTGPPPSLASTQHPQWLVIHAPRPMDTGALKALLIANTWPNTGPDSPAWNLAGGALANAEQGRWITVLGALGMATALATLGIGALDAFTRQTRPLAVLATYDPARSTLHAVGGGTVGMPLALGGILAALQSLFLVQIPIAERITAPFGTELALGIVVSAIVIAAICTALATKTLQGAIAKWRPAMRPH